jgi:glucosamine--fructose-6-phosphate aminotransferase (isomerizing)
MPEPDRTAIVAIRKRVERTIPWREASTGGEAIAAALRVARAADAALVERLQGASHIVVAGAGSSLYVAQVGAFALRQQAGIAADAQPLSEVLLRPGSVFAGSPVAEQPLVVVSRSGSTTEALEVLRAARARGQLTVAITCRPSAPMAGLADFVLAVPEADEEAIVMTRSFVAQAAVLLGLAARLGGERSDRFAADLEAVPSRWVETAPFIERAFELAAAGPTRLVVLGAGAAFGIANEAVLKATETSQVPASAYHPLEFRHGPMSVSEPGVVIVGLLGGDSADAERRVVDESAALGSTPFVLGPDGPGADLDPTARLLLAMYVLQALALGIAVERGLDPETPRHLEQVVVIEDGRPSA